jgi:hypothetical protein
MLNAEDSSGPVSGAVPCPAMPRRFAPERMTMAMPRSPNRCGLDVAGHARHRLLLLSATDTIRKGVRLPPFLPYPLLFLFRHRQPSLQISTKYRLGGGKIISFRLG